MAITKPEAMDFSKKNITIIISGLPGTGKTTLALSAPDVLLIDTDNGISRVNVAHRKDTSICNTFDELKADVAAAKGVYKTIAIDTGGALVEMMKDYIIDNPQDFKGGSQTTGGISQKGYGYVKKLWNDFTRDLRKNFNVVYIFHESVSKNGDDGLLYELVVEGSTRTTVYQSADLAAHLFVNNKQRYLGFTPTEQYSAKACYGVSGLIPVPELKDGEPNDFLTKLFDKVHANIEAESKSLAPQKATYDAAVKEAKAICEAVNAPKDVEEAGKALRTLEHALTSEKEAKAMLKKRLDELGIVWDKANRVYVYKES